MGIDDTNKAFMPPRQANYVPLSPLSFIVRAARVFPEREAVLHGSRRYNWRQSYQRCVRLAAALRQCGLQVGDVVTLMAHNTPEMFEAQFGVAMSGAVLNTLNTRLDATTIAGILEHADTKLLITDACFAEVMRAALDKIPTRNIAIIDIADSEAEESLQGERLGSMDYESFLQTGDDNFAWELPADEWQAICLNYTSGTGGKPKGVVCHHRGAYLMAMGTVPAWGVPLHPIYLYSVPMFHCNGWGHAWMLALLAGTMICTRKITAQSIFAMLHAHRITHFGGAPTVLGMLANADAAVQISPDWDVKLMTAGSPPPAAVLAKVEALGFDVMQVYGLTETYGHVVHCAWNSDWDELGFAERASIKARQGVQLPHSEEIAVLDQATGLPVPSDGESMGELMIRSNTVMKGYHKDSEATQAAFADGYFHTGDLAVRHANGYIEVKDRLKDIIISGGENISSVEVENMLYNYPYVAFAAVVAEPSEKWGESPCAFVEMQAGKLANEADIIAFCKEHMAGFKVPKRVIFQEIPKTSTGKLQKFLLRQQLRRD